MAGDEPEVGDQVSWQYGSSHPGGEVSEKKTEGEAAVQSKRGNTIKKQAKPDDPAIALSRPGNDVVKNQSELQVDEKTSKDKFGGGGGDAEKIEEKSTNGDSAPQTGDKRKAADDADEDGDDKADEPEAKKAKGARGRPKGSGTPASAKKTAEPKSAKATPAKKAAAEKKEAKPKSAAAAKPDGEKKARGRPKGPNSGEKKPKKEAKPKKPAAPPTGVGKRTRSNK